MHLQSEATADGRHEHADLSLGQPVQAREHGAHEERHLRGRPDRQVTRPVGDAAAALQRRRVRPPEVEALHHDVGRVGESPGDVAVLELDVREVVGVGPLVEQRCVPPERLLRIHDGVQRFVLDLDELARVLGEVPGRRDDGCDRLADVADTVAREERPAPGSCLRP